MTEPAANRRNPDSRKREGSYSLDHLTWPEVGRTLARDSRLILPVGALEQYGPHLPLGVNTLIAETLARDLSRETGVLLAPTLWCGVTAPTRDVYAGSAGLRRKTLHRVVNELLAAWEDHGVTDFLIITAHRYEPHLDALLMAALRRPAPRSSISTPSRSTTCSKDRRRESTAGSWRLHSFYTWPQIVCAPS
jgi:creatinine amidohydrolase/Fe(II)-dependent formamide hydrolase-like protein